MEWLRTSGYHYNLYSGKAPYREEDVKYMWAYNDPHSIVGSLYSKYTVVKWKNESFFRLKMFANLDFGENYKKQYGLPRRYDHALIKVKDFKTLKEAKAYAEAIERGEIEVTV